MKEAIIFFCGILFSMQLVHSQEIEIIASPGNVYLSCLETGDNAVFSLYMRDENMNRIRVELGDYSKTVDVFQYMLTEKNKTKGVTSLDNGAGDEMVFMEGKWRLGCNGNGYVSISVAEAKTCMDSLYVYGQRKNPTIAGVFHFTEKSPSYYFKRSSRKQLIGLGLGVLAGGMALGLGANADGNKLENIYAISALVGVVGGIVYILGIADLFEAGNELSKIQFSNNGVIYNF